MIKLTRDNLRARDNLQMNPHRHNSIRMKMSMKCDTVVSHKGHKRKDTTMTHMPIDCLDKNGRRKSIQRNQNVTLIKAKLKTADTAWAWFLCDQLWGEQGAPLDTVLYHSRYVDGEK